MTQTLQQPPPPLPSAPDLEVGQRWRFPDGREGVVAVVRPGIEVVAYVGPQRLQVPAGEVWAAFLGAERLDPPAAEAAGNDAPLPHAACASIPPVLVEEAREATAPESRRGGRKPRR